MGYELELAPLNGFDELDEDVVVVGHEISELMEDAVCYQSVGPLDEDVAHVPFEEEVED
jgi:hypothetical protein